MTINKSWKYLISLLVGLLFIITSLLFINIKGVSANEATYNWLPHFNHNFNDTSKIFWEQTPFWDNGVGMDYESDQPIKGEGSLNLVNSNIFVKGGGNEVILGGTSASGLPLRKFDRYRVQFLMRAENIKNMFFRLDGITLFADMQILIDTDGNYTIGDGFYTENDETIGFNQSVSYNQELDAYLVKFEFMSLSAASFAILATPHTNTASKITIDEFSVDRVPYVAPVAVPVNLASEIDFENESLNNIFTSENSILTTTSSAFAQSEIVLSKNTSLKAMLSYGKNHLAELKKSDDEGFTGILKFYMLIKPNEVSRIVVKFIDIGDSSVLHEFDYNLSQDVRNDGVGDESKDIGTYNKGLKHDSLSFFVNTDREGKFVVEAYGINARSYVVLDDISTLIPAPSYVPATETPAYAGKYETSPFDIGTNGIASFISSNSSLIIGLVFGAVICTAIITVVILFKNKITKKLANKVLYKTGLFILIIAIMGTSVTFNFTSNDINSMAASNEIRNYSYYYPEKISGKLDNQGLGWVALEEPNYMGGSEIGYSGTLPEIDNIGLSGSWAHIEVSEGVYDFTSLDTIIDYWTSEGKEINLRICTDTLMLPYTYMGVPEWLIDKYNVPFIERTYSDGGPVPVVKVIDTRDANYRIALDKFLNAVYEQYKFNEFVRSVEIRGFGVWGEWHSGHSFDSMEDRIASLSYIVDSYVDVFAKSDMDIILSSAWEPNNSSTPDAATNVYEEYVNYSAFDYLWRMEGRTTFRRDSGTNLLRTSTDSRLMADSFRSNKKEMAILKFGTEAMKKWVTGLLLIKQGYLIMLNQVKIFL